MSDLSVSSAELPDAQFRIEDAGAAGRDRREGRAGTAIGTDQHVGRDARDRLKAPDARRSRLAGALGILTYRLSLYVAAVVQAALERASLGDRSTSIMRQLALESGERYRWPSSPGHAQIVKRVEAQVVVRAEVRAGTLLSLSDSSSGRVPTAFAEPEYRRLLRQKGGQLAPEEVRTSGFAVSLGRDIPGVRSVAVPVLDNRGNCIGALSIVTPESRLEHCRFLRPILDAAQQLRRMMF